MKWGEIHLAGAIITGFLEEVTVEEVMQFKQEERAIRTLISDPEL